MLLILLFVRYVKVKEMYLTVLIFNYFYLQNNLITKLNALKNEKKQRKKQWKEQWKEQWREQWKEQWKEQ